MNKTLQFDKFRLSLTVRLQLAAAILLLICGLLTWMTWQHFGSQARSSNDEKLNSQYDHRVEQLHSVFSAKSSTLKVMSALIPELESMDNSEFMHLFSPILAEIDANYICWNDLINNLEYRTPHSAEKCDDFQLFRTAIVHDGKQPGFTLTVPAGGQSSIRSGFISLDVDLSKISNSGQSQDFDEYLFINDKNKLSIDSYKIGNRGLVHVALGEAKKGVPFRFSHVLNLDDIEIVYYLNFRNPSYTQSALVSFAVFLSTFIVCSAILLLIWKNRVLDNQIEKRTEELSQFAYRAAHDMKSPLTSMRQLADFTVQDANGGHLDTAVEGVKRIREQAKNLESMLSDLYDLSNSTNILSTIEPIDFDQMFREICDRHEELITSKGVVVKLSTSKPLPTQFHRTRVTQIIDNLISNGVKYADPNTAQSIVELNVTVINSRLVLTFTDNGVGFGEKFFESSKLSTFSRYRPDLAPGSGVGLSIVSKHVEKLHGTLLFEQLKQGTTITVSLPIPRESM